MIRNLLRFNTWLFFDTLGLFVYCFDKMARTLLRLDHKTEYLRKGQCRNTGQCCHNIGIGLPNSMIQINWINRAVIAYYEFIHNFEFKFITDSRFLVFKCRHLRPDHLCGIYPFRPKLCREFPQAPLFGKKFLHPGCGFSFEKRNPSDFDQVLAKKNSETTYFKKD